MGADADYRATATIQLDGIEIEHIEQDAGSGYTRLHNITEPTLVYMLPTGDPPAMGSFEPPASHQSFRPFGSMLALPPHQPLYVLSPPSGRREMLVLRFDRTLWGRMPGIAEALEAISFELWADIRSGGLLNALERISVEMSSRDRAQSALLSGLALIALGELVRHLDDNPAMRAGALAPWQMRRIETRVGQDGQAPDVSELAKICGISPRHMMRVFKTATGETLMSYIERVRFERARKMLASGVAIKRVAALTGFSSQGSFSSSFRRIHKLTPSEFRRRLVVE